ncbi:MAG: hypothetical protein KGI60_02715 [Patescibacteria group bacterium]|nr:hypothetical protein [Patescibacteria group bacterium]
MRFEKQKSSIERVVGVPPEGEREIMKGMAETFDAQDIEKLKTKEREKTKEELVVIDLANDATNALRREYGMDDFDVPAKNVHIIPRKKWPKEMAHELGSCLELDQAIIIREETQSRIQFLTTAIHELLHFKSYTALRMTGGKEESGAVGIGRYRNGLSTVSRDGAQVYFTALNEAITQELSKRLLEEVLVRERESPLFAEEIQNTETVVRRYGGVRTSDGRRLIPPGTLYAAPRSSKPVEDISDYLSRGGSVDVKALTYSWQRRILVSLVKNIYQKHADQFKNESEVFDVFARAYMTGDLLPMGRLVEETYGKGSFKKLATLDLGDEKASDRKAEK